MLANIDSLDVYYEQRGSGRPILMLHGGYLDHRHMMEEMEPAFFDRTGWLRLYPDLPAHGRTPALSRPMTFDAILDHVMRFADAVAPGRRYAVSGMSAGGHLVRGLVAKCPKRLNGAMINAAPFVVDYDRRDRPPSLTLFEEQAFEDLAGDGADMLRNLQPVRNAALADWYRHFVVPAKTLVNEEAATESWLPENYAFSFDPDDLTEPFTAPSLILAGRQDTVAGYRDAWMSIESYPRATFATLDGCGHLIGPARRRVFVALVADWLERMESEAAD